MDTMSRCTSAAKSGVLITTQVSLIGSLAYVWFSTGVHSIWDHVSHTNKDSLSVLSLKPYTFDGDVASSSHSQSQFALLSALTHTLVLVMGIVVMGAITKALSPSPAPSKRGCSEPATNKKAVGSLKLVASISFLLFFFVITKTYFKHAFDAREGLVYQVSSSFFYESGVEPFAILGSTSYSESRTRAHRNTMAKTQTHGCTHNPHHPRHLDGVRLRGEGILAGHGRSLPAGGVKVAPHNW